ncbi:hypothetical protein ACLB2K_067085 [Fragaria x ananassa]
MSAYENVVGGKLNLKGKALDVKAAGIKKKKKHKKHQEQISLVNQKELAAGGSTEELTNPDEEDMNDDNKSREDGKGSYDEYLTPAERRYIEQREQIDNHRLPCHDKLVFGENVMQNFLSSSLSISYGDPYKQLWKQQAALGSKGDQARFLTVIGRLATTYSLPENRLLT